MVSEQLKRVILTELELEDWDIQDGTTASMVPGWDSLNHARIISAVETQFNIRFRTAEILKLQTVGQLQTLVDAKIGTR
jgi:acyl carrier protein